MRDELLSEESPPSLILGMYPSCTHHEGFWRFNFFNFYIARLITIERPLGGKLAKQTGGGSNTLNDQNCDVRAVALLQRLYHVQ